MVFESPSARINFNEEKHGLKPAPQTPRPPKPPGSKPTCEHKYVHYDCKKKQKYLVTTGMTEWTRIDYFFCEKCLDEKEKRKHEVSRDRPEWF
ncbi:hypothetical protein [Parageobacillus thermoglucosidasius]|uniref:hypothetical protein n=1 Tax=Parageobacillus thermoglucosidasius TaxID=1426 RepID=UPI000B5685F1|nr:hypothetical protein [Parageobacillus thermoglucosidasius]MBY6269331.1 hypothetical protein [Parageobacillus thermoglucosidasius]OUM84935.1 MAG: hypothetical protein BAA00_02440 [Parageobacillus thermoglucosidasius]